MRYIYHNFNTSEQEFSKEEIDKAIARINDLAFSFIYKDELGLFIRNSQNALSNFKSNQKNSHAADQILHFLETNYSEHLDNTLPVSDISRHHLIDSFGSGLGLIEKVVNELPIHLLEISYPILSLNKGLSISLNQYRYLRSFYPLLINKIVRGDFIADEDNWLSFLIKANFNELKFTKYLVNKIIKETSQEDFLQNRLEILLDYQKDYSQSVEEMNYLYMPNLPSVNKQILNWLEFEIKHCKNKIRHQNENQSVIEFKQRSKFKTSLSVPKLLSFFDSLKDSGVIVNTSLQEILRAINESFETIGSDDISVKSLKNKYHALDNNSRQETKRLLIEVANRIS